MKNALELKADLQRITSSMEDVFNVETLKNDFFNKYLQREEAALVIYDTDNNKESVPVSIRDVFIKRSSYALWHEEGYSFTAVRVVLGSYNNNAEFLEKCEINLIYNHEMELTDADYYKISAK